MLPASAEPESESVGTGLWLAMPVKSLVSD